MTEKDETPELLLEAALRAIQQIQADYWRTKVLALLAPYLPQTLLEEALFIVRTIKARDKRDKAIAALAPYLSEELLEKTLVIARKIEIGIGQGVALAALVARLTELGQLEKALVVIDEIKSNDWQVKALAAVVSRLANLRQLSEGLAVARKIKSDTWQTEAIAVLAAHLPPHLLEEAFFLACNIKTEEQRVRALLVLAPYLPEQLLNKALTVGLNIRTESWQNDALVGLIPYLPKHLLQKALVAAKKVKDKDRQGKAQALLASRLAELGQVKEALILAQSIEIESWGVKALTNLLPYLPHPEKGEVFEIALATARKIKAELRQAKAWIYLVPWLVKFSRVEEALTTVQSLNYWREEALLAVVQGLAELGRLEEALAAAQEFAPGDGQADAQAILVPKLAESGQVEEALALAQQIKSTDLREKALVSLIPWLAELPPTTRNRLWQEILDLLKARLEARHIPVNEEQLWVQELNIKESLEELRTLTPVLAILGGIVVVAEVFQFVALKLEYAAPPMPPLHAAPPIPPVFDGGDHGVFEQKPITQLPQLLRYPNIDCPNRAIVNQKFSLFVQLLIKPPEPGVEAIEVKDTGVLEQLPEVEVVLRAHNFDIVDGNTKVLQVERNDDSEERFILIPRCLGEEQIRIDFYQHGRRIGTARHNLMVMEKLANIDVPQPKTPPSIELKTKATVPPPDLELCIELDQHNGRTLYFTLHSTLEAVGYHQAKFGQVTLKGSPLEQMQQLVYQEMSRLAAPIKQAEKDLAERRMASLGNELWDELIPDKLKQEYWRFKSLVKTILITSDEPWVPWELMKPYRYNDNDEREDDPFWCQQFAISRWLSGPGTADELLVGAARPVAPIHVNLRSVQEEVSFIKHLRDLHPDIISLEPFSDCMEVLQWLEKGEFSMLHFACHGMFDATTPDNSGIVLSGSSLRPSDIRVRFGGRRPRPLLFINACHGARTGFSFTGLGGWAERLVEARVGAFVGAMWEVNDGLALQFARRFYTGLLKDNQTIAEAFRQAREEIRQLAPYNSTWLAYSLYADPEGRFKYSPLADKPSAEIRKTDSNHINSSDTPPSNSNQNSTEVRNAQNKKSLRLKWWIQYIIAPLIGVVIVYVITAIINAPTSKSPQQEPFHNPKPNTLVN